MHLLNLVICDMIFIVFHIFCQCMQKSGRSPTTHIKVDGQVDK